MPSFLPDRAIGQFNSRIDSVGDLRGVLSIITLHGVIARGAELRART
jgi:hypothetical protein